MTDFILAYAAALDAEPSCRCAETDRGTDTLGCALHDDARRCQDGQHLLARAEG